MYSLNNGGFSSKVSVSISRTVLRPSEMYRLSSWQAYEVLARLWNRRYVNLHVGRAQA
jgi:hypothetical protein